MAVHLNARLKTRFIPFLFTVAVLATACVAIARASDAPVEDEEAFTFRVVADPAEDEDVAEELKAVMSESVDPRRLDRRPGLSPIVYEAEPGLYR